MRCEDAERALSAAMDGAPSATSELDDHVRDCPRCGSFQAGAWRIREAVRLEVAPTVPDLVPAIMDRLRGTGNGSGTRVRTLPPSRRGMRTSWISARAAAAAVAAGLVAGFVITAGGLIPRGSGGSAALASEVPHQLVRAAVNLDGYRATYRVTERNWNPAVPVRTFVATVAFRAPESFSVSVDDATPYPAGPWPRNDLLLMSDGHAWRAFGPDPCPATALPACPSSRPRLTEIVDRPPFDPRSPMPSDVIVPMTLLAAQDRVDVIGPDLVSGREAEAVQLAYRDAGPLFAYLRFAGSWRPYFPDDRVVVWLDRRSWFPLRYEVFPAAGPERALWAAQNGLPSEATDRPVFTATVDGGRFSTTAPPAVSFDWTRSFHPPFGLVGNRPTATDPPGGTRIDEGFRDLPIAEAAADGSALSGFRPDDGAGASLPLVRFGRFERTGDHPFGQTVASYARGLAWLTVTGVDGWNQRRLFGVGPFPEPVAIPGGGIGYYEPATSTDPRRIALHTAEGELLVATDLPLAALLQAAAALHVRALPEPADWRVHRWAGGIVEQGLTPSQAVADISFPVLTPGWLPPGYRAAAAETVSAPATEGVTLVFRRPAAELDGIGLRLYQATGSSLPPPNDPSEEQVLIRGALGRWSPEDHTLEWVEAGVYRSITGPAFGLASVLRVAGSLRASTGAGSAG